MNEPSNIAALFAVDLTSSELLSEAVEEFLSVNVIPVPNDHPPSILTPVKINVLLPLERELFLKGTVILHRPGGFLVQVETPVDLTFLRLTVRDATIEKVKAAKLQHSRESEAALRQSDNLSDVIGIPEDKVGKVNENAARTSSTGNQAARAAAGRPINPTADPLNDPSPTRPGIKVKRSANATDRNRIDIEFAEDFEDGEDDEFDVSSVIAVDDVTGQAKPAGRKEPAPAPAPIPNPVPPPPPPPAPAAAPEPASTPIPPATSRSSTAQTPAQKPGNKPAAPPTLAMWAVRDNPAEEQPQFGSTGTKVMHPVNKPVSSDPVDELFALAADAGGLDSAGTDEIQSSTSEESTNPDFYRPAGLSGTVSEAAFRATAAADNEPAPDNSMDDSQDREQESPENRELAVKIREMSAAEKQRLARQGRRIARRILIRDNDKTIHKYVFFNPEMRVEEVIEYTRWSGLAPEAIEYITANRSWMESREVVFNIVRNPSTPTELAVRYLIKLTANEWRVFSRPGVVKPAVMNQARRLLFEAEKKSGA
jgi:hypothetical protein